MKCPACKTEIPALMRKGRFVCRHCNSVLEAKVTAHTAIAMIVGGLVLAALTLYFLGTSFWGLTISAAVISIFYYGVHSATEIKVVGVDKKSDDMY
jgi:hypothetical protein